MDLEREMLQVSRVVLQCTILDLLRLVLLLLAKPGQFVASQAHLRNIKTIGTREDVVKDENGLACQVRPRKVGLLRELDAHPVRNALISFSLLLLVTHRTSIPNIILKVSYK